MAPVPTAPGQLSCPFQGLWLEKTGWVFLVVVVVVGYPPAFLVLSFSSPQAGT